MFFLIAHLYLRFFLFIYFKRLNIFYASFFLTLFILDCLFNSYRFFPFLWLSRSPFYLFWLKFYLSAIIVSIIASLTINGIWIRFHIRINLAKFIFHYCLCRNLFSVNCPGNVIFWISRLCSEASHKPVGMVSNLIFTTNYTSVSYAFCVTPHSHFINNCLWTWLKFFVFSFSCSPILRMLIRKLYAT